LLGRKRAPGGKLERTVSQASSGALVDYLKRYVNQAGTAARRYEDTLNPHALDELLDAAEAIPVIAQELKRRVKESDFSPLADSHLQELVEEFQLRHGGSTPPGVLSQP
jgi:hypothetical protein